jgi:hypothetical protein
MQDIYLMDPLRTRRELLGTAGVADASLVAGCSGARDAPTGTGSDDTATDTPDADLRIDERYLSSAFPIEFVDLGFDDRTGFAGDARIAYVHWHGADVSHWHQSPLELAAGEQRAGRTRFLFEGADAVPLGPDGRFSQAVRPAAGEGAPVRTAVDGARVDVFAQAAGQAELLFELRIDGESGWVSPPLPVEIV